MSSVINFKTEPYGRNFVVKTKNTKWEKFSPTVMSNAIIGALEKVKTFEVFKL